MYCPWAAPWINVLQAGLGTGGTMTGAGRRLKELNPHVELIAVQPDSPLHGIEGLKHMATAIVPGIFEMMHVSGTPEFKRWFGDAVACRESSFGYTRAGRIGCRSFAVECTASAFGYTLQV